MKKIAVLFAAVAALGALMPVAARAQDQCTVSAQVEGGGLLDQGKVKFNSFDIPVLNWVAGFGEAAARMGCGAVWGQVDAAYYGFGASAGGANLSQSHGHGGAVIAWKASDTLSIGLAASFIGQKSTAPPTPYNQNGSMLRAGTFVQASLNDVLQLGGGVHHVGGTTPWLGDWTQNMAIDGWEGEAVLRIYPTNNLSFSLRGDLGSYKLTYNGGAFQADYGGHAFSAEMEYLVPSTNLSFFAGGRIANRTVSFFTNVDVLDDTQGFIGFKYSFGAGVPGSLRSRDMNGAYDNASTFQEKLPDLGGPAPFS